MAQPPRKIWPVSLWCFVRYNVEYIRGGDYNDNVDSRQIWLSDVTCTGRETYFTQCGHAGWGIDKCRDYPDVAISCAAAGFSSAAAAAVSNYAQYAGNQFRCRCC